MRRDIEQRIAQILEAERDLFADLMAEIPVAGLRRLDLPKLLHAVALCDKYQAD